MEYCFYKLLFIHILGFLEFQKSFVPKNSKKQKKEKTTNHRLQRWLVCTRRWPTIGPTLQPPGLCFSRRLK
jgi:hypothetical protein